MDLRKHWNSVSDLILERGSDNLLAGFDCVLDRYIRREFEKEFRKQNLFSGSVMEIGNGMGINLEICKEKTHKE